MILHPISPPIRRATHYAHVASRTKSGNSFMLIGQTGIFCFRCGILPCLPSLYPAELAMHWPGEAGRAALLTAVPCVFRASSPLADAQPVYSRIAESLPPNGRKKSSNESFLEWSRRKIWKTLGGLLGAFTAAQKNFSTASNCSHPLSPSASSLVG